MGFPSLQTVALWVGDDNPQLCRRFARLVEGYPYSGFQPSTRLTDGIFVRVLLFLCLTKYLPSITTEMV